MNRIYTISNLLGYLQQLEIRGNPIEDLNNVHTLIKYEQNQIALETQEMKKFETFTRQQKRYLERKK